MTDVDGGHLPGADRSVSIWTTSACVVTSRPVVGSSQTISSGSQAMAMAMAMRCN